MLGLLLLAVAPFGAVMLASAALGGVIEMVNLRLLDRTVSWLLGLAGSGQSAFVQMLLLARFFLLMSACAIALILLPVDALGFTLGFSSVVPAALWHGLQPAREANGF